MFARMRTNSRCEQFGSESGPPSRRGAVNPEIVAGREAEVPLERVARAPGVLLTARRVLEVNSGAVDFDRARHLDCRLDADVGHRRKEVPRRQHERKGSFTRVPAKVPAHRSPFTFDLTRTPVVNQQRIAEPERKRPPLYLERTQRKQGVGAPVGARILVIETEAPEGGVGFGFDTERWAECRVANPVPLARRGLVDRYVPGLVGACPALATGGVRRV